MQGLSNRWRRTGLLMVVLLAAVLAMSSSPDAKLEYALRQIITEHGFKYENSYVPSMFEGRKDPQKYEAILKNRTTYSYVGQPISQEIADRVIAQLENASPNCRVRAQLINQFGAPVVSANNEPVYYTYDVYMPKGSSVVEVMILSDVLGLRSKSSPPDSVLKITRINKASPSTH